MPTGAALPGVLDRCQQPRVGQQPIQPRQLRRQLGELHRQQLIDQRLDLVTRQPQHPHPPTAQSDGPNHPLTRNGMPLSRDYFRGK
jgi:hypothetical protein